MLLNIKTLFLSVTDAKVIAKNNKNNSFAYFFIENNDFVLVCVNRYVRNGGILA